MPKFGARQDRAVIREFYDAEQSGNTDLADRIVRANRDLFEFDESGLPTPKEHLRGA